MFSMSFSQTSSLIARSRRFVLSRFHHTSRSAALSQRSQSQAFRSRYFSTNVDTSNNSALEEWEKQEDSVYQHAMTNHGVSTMTEADAERMFQDLYAKKTTPVDDIRINIAIKDSDGAHYILRDLEPSTTIAQLKFKMTETKEQQALAVQSSGEKGTDSASVSSDDDDNSEKEGNDNNDDEEDEEEEEEEVPEMEFMTHTEAEPLEDEKTLLEYKFHLPPRMHANPQFGDDVHIIEVPREQEMIEEVLKGFGLEDIADKFYSYDHLLNARWKELKNVRDVPMKQRKKIRSCLNGMIEQEKYERLQ